MSVWSAAVASLFDVFWPERCALCGADAGDRPWAPAGPHVPGLRRWDRPHLCRACLDGARGEPLLREVPLPSGGVLPIAAGRAEGADLVGLVGAAKYHGVRGALWPLAEIALAGAALGRAAGGPVAALVPVPLHGARRRERGFNQADVLARLLAAALGIGCLDTALRRRRRTAQQARIASDDPRRAANVAGAFAAMRPPRAGEGAIALVDDLATSGVTLAAAAAALAAAGWEVRWALVAGAAAHAAGSRS